MIFDNIVKNVGVLKKIKESAKTDFVLGLGGAGIGEKILSVYSTREKCVVIANDVISMAEYKEGLESLGLRVGEVYVDLSSPVYSVVKDDSLKIKLIKNVYDFLLGKIDVLILSLESLLYKFPKKIDEKNAIKLIKNEEYSFKEITEKLIKNGYKKCQIIEKMGDFSVKGDILDIFLPNFENPVRLDFFDVALEKIYTFDISDMQKIENLESVDIYPVNLYSFDENEKEQIIQNLKNSLLSLSINGDALIKANLIVNEIIEGLKENIISCDIPYLRPFFEKEYSILDMLGETKIFVDEPKRIFDELNEISKSLLSDIYDYIQSGKLLDNHSNFYLSPIKALNFKANFVFSMLEQNIFKTNIYETFRTIGTRNYVFDYKALINDLFIYEKSKYKIVLFAGSDDSKNSVSEFLIKYNIYPSDEINFGTNKFQVVVSNKKFNKSCSFLHAGVILIGTDDLIKKTKKDVKNISTKSKKRKVFYLPKVGDFIVHETHGIGKCVALEKLNLNGNEKDYFIIEYMGGDKLYLPSEQADLISAYMGGDANPRLNKIGGEQFAKIKQKVKESVGKLAINLLEIYSKREKSKGFVYSKDNYLFDEFENAFAYDETEDQLNAILDIKNDMESTRIMDRLICGDVGYGKTEVALRAIYKAILDGKQVAFLCPTTILSQQHYQTAKERFNGFMVNVQVLNRFKTKSQQDEILKELKDGRVDLIIGTHRLLSSDVVFKDLGLLVLDEEQRFGVADKEKIKKLKENVDVLTLSATPIPRTLNMALTGIRDISIIETPPKERIAVKTYVQEESDTLILNACKKELARGGQVLYVFNRVEHIYEQAERLKELLPNARVGVAHGQMPEKLLEQTIMSLYNKEYDILVATTLIESGIDLPLANTLIVIDADRLGLSELYQLRGRIGRSDRTAYAYFTYNPSKVLTSDAYKRLDAILEFTELGSGFKIAMRDLEIRGAGDILGKEQHGHLEKVGYDLYCKLLNDAVKELKGEKVKESKPIKIDIQVSANLSNNYVESEEERIKLYSKISEISTDSEFNELYQNIKETYGELPKEAERLLKIAYIKNLAILNGVKRILLNANVCNIYLYKTSEIMTDNLNLALANRKNGVLKFEDVPIISFDLKMANIDSKIDYLLQFFKEGRWWLMTDAL